MGIVQLIVPFLVTFAVLGAVFGGGSQTKTDPATGATGEVFLQNAAFFWVPLILLAALCAPTPSPRDAPRGCSTSGLEIPPEGWRTSRCSKTAR